MNATASTTPQCTPKVPSTTWRWLMWVMVLIVILWVYRQVSVGTVWALFSHFGPFSIALLIVLRGMILVVLSSRWQLFLSAIGHPIDLLTMIGYNLVGFGLSYFTPGPQWGGEPIQVYLLKHRHQVPTADAVATLTLDKLLSTLAQGSLLLFGLCLVFTWKGSEAFIHRSLFVGLMLVAVPLGYMILLWQGKYPFTRLLQTFPACINRHGQTILAKTETILGEFCRHKTGIFCQGVLRSFVVWPLLLGLEFWLALRFLGVTVSISQLVIIVASSRVAMFTPLPAGIGILEASQLFAMQVLGLDPMLGVALSLLIRSRDMTMGGIGMLLAALWMHRQPSISNGTDNLNYRWRFKRKATRSIPTSAKKYHFAQE